MRILYIFILLLFFYDLTSQVSPNGCLNDYYSKRNSLYNELFVEFDVLELSIAEGDFSNSNSYPKMGAVAYVSTPGEYRKTRLRATTDNVNNISPYRSDVMPGYGYKINVEDAHNIDGRPDVNETSYFYIYQTFEGWPVKTKGQIWSRINDRWIPIGYAETLEKAVYFGLLHNAVLRNADVLQENNSQYILNEGILNLSLMFQSISNNCVTPSKVLGCFRQVEDRSYLYNDYHIEKLMKTIVEYQSEFININSITTDEFEKIFPTSYLLIMGLRENVEEVTNSIECSFIMNR